MMANTTDPIDEILDACGLKGPWEPLNATGVANRIYATKDVVIRVANGHQEALKDARTESIAAPAAYAAGVLTPRLLVFDDSRKLLAGPYSVWERVHGETLGLLSLDPLAMAHTWRQVGYQMALLHVQVKQFDDPMNYLHEPTRNLNLESLLEQLTFAGRISAKLTKEIARLIKELHTAVLEEAKICFLHSDVHAMNIMCTQDDELLALIDWGDAGWGDPTFDFRQVPLLAFSSVLAGYRELAPNLLGETLIERAIWDKLSDAMEKSLQHPSYRIPIDEYRQFLDMNSKRKR
ncbi:MAG: aminoglycoside phosphotransferase family protein [Chloroflexi bacterium]|nr:aminoglycoside phosphotransferase family protein [Chloroflexota bacterium]